MVDELNGIPDPPLVDDRFFQTFPDPLGLQHDEVKSSRELWPRWRPSWARLGWTEASRSVHPEAELHETVYRRLSAMPSATYGVPAVGVTSVQRPDVGIQTVASDPQAFINQAPFFASSSSSTFPRGLELSEELTPVSLVRVQLDALVAEAVLLEAPVDHVEGRRLFRHEEDRPAVGEAVRDHVRDGGLARSRRPDDDEVDAFAVGRPWRLPESGWQQTDDLRGVVSGVELALVYERRRALAPPKACSGVSMRCRTTRFSRRASVRST